MNSRCSKSGESGDGPEFGKIRFNQVSDKGSLQRLVLAREVQTGREMDCISFTERIRFGKSPDDYASSGLRALPRRQLGADRAAAVVDQ